MSLSSRSIAMMGVGYSSRNVAVHGLVPVQAPAPVVDVSRLSNVQKHWGANKSPKREKKNEIAVKARMTFPISASGVIQKKIFNEDVIKTKLKDKQVNIIKESITIKVRRYKKE